MSEFDASTFLLWSVLTGIIVGVTGFSYRSYLRRRKNDVPSS
ncbi:MAG: hypothetical protein ACE5R5_02560 [Nitrosarchaeum sp.]